MKTILATFVCTAAIIGQISTTSAQYYYYGSPAGIYRPPPAQPQQVPGWDYYYGSPAGICCPPLAQPQQAPGWAYNPRNQPMGYGEPYPPTYLANGRPVCAHRNYRPINGLCQRVW
jgi:hypothetical protein